MRFEELAPWLFGRAAGGIRWGLERTRVLLAEADDPHTRFRSLHIGGTNGKGSVAALCDAVLRRVPGRRVGLYTSPHLVSFTERIRIDGRPVEPAALLGAAERLRPAIERTGATFFEATTALAFRCFADAGVDVAVVEVGLGGRLDATNVLLPAAAAITNVAREHTEYLGDTLEQIAREKAGILKPGVPAVTAERDEAVLRVFRERAAQVGAPLATLDERVTLEAARTGIDGTRLFVRSSAWGAQELFVPLPGEFQARNALLAAELLALLPADLRPAAAELRDGFRSAWWPGRLQLHRGRGTTWLLDVAHNPAGVAVLCQALDALELPRPRVLLAGILADKDWREMLPPLLARCNAAILTVPPSAPPTRRWDPAAAAGELAGPVAPRVMPDFAAALERAGTLAPDGTVVVTGSIHTVGDAMEHLGIPPFPEAAGR